MIAPAWLQNPTQPIAIEDTLSYLVQALDVEESNGQEIQIGGPDVLSYGDMLDRMAAVLGIPNRPRIPVPLITPVAIIRVDRARYTGRRRRGTAPDRGTGDPDRRHQPLRDGAVRDPTDQLR